MFFQTVDGAGYGISSYGLPILTFDPYAFSPSRNFINIVIGCGIILSCILVWNNYYRHNETVRVANKMYLLSIFSTMSLIASGLHHIDNFLRMKEYYLTSWIYNGFLFILDIGLYNWVIAAIFLVYGNKYLYSSSDSVRKWGFRLMYIHCVMIWSGQMHYSIEPMSSFRLDANISILSEGACAILLHLFVLYLDYRVFASATAYVAVATSEEDDVEMKNASKGIGPVRRRSKDGAAGNIS